jgi:multiple sugar transport system substrate-binding protein
VQYLSSMRWTQRFALEFAIMSVLLLIMAPFAACGGGSGSSSSGSSSTSSGPVNLTFWGWIPYADSVAIFNKTHPGIHVTWANVGASTTEYDKLFTAIKANNEPDIAEIEYQLIPSFEATGSLLDLSPYGANSIKDQFVPWSWNQTRVGNAIYAIPEDSGPMGMFYRADLFKKYNLPVPTTWAQFADDAAKLHAANPNDYITDFPPKDGPWFTGLVWQAGSHPFSINGQSWKVAINNPAAQRVASYWQDLINKKLVKTEPDYTNAWYHDLQTGAVATWIEAVWGSGTLRENAPQTAGDWRVAPMPQWQAGQMAAGNVGGGGDVVFKTTKHPKEAAEFASWLGTNTQNLDILIKGAGAVYPAAQAGLALPSLNGTQPFFGNQVINEVFQPASRQIDYNFQWGPTMNQTFSDMSDDFANAINGKGTLTSQLNTVQQQTVAFMQKQGFSIST